jgi:hypothetical protein
MECNRSKGNFVAACCNVALICSKILPKLSSDEFLEAMVSCGYDVS